MSGLGSILTPGNSFSFSKEGKFLENSVTAGITVQADPQAALALTTNAPFPPGPIKLGNLAAKISGDTGSINFGDGKGVVSFKGSGGFNSGLGVYDTASQLLQDLDPQKTILQGLMIDGAGAARFVLLNWGYNIAASLKGSVALGGGASLTFGADGATDGLFAVIRGFGQNPLSRDAIQAAISSWMLPRQVGSVDDLAPGTWLIAEVDGEIGVKVGAQFGYNYNWIRKVNLGTLSGDVGLKIQAAVDATLGFNASGKYLITVARESLDPSKKVVRLRLFKMAKKGWDFAFNASVGVTGNTGTLLPAQIDDFIKGIFGVHGAQIVEDLKLFDKWTDPKTPLPDLFSGFVSTFVTNQLSSLAGPEIQKLTEARNRIAGFLTLWENLGHTTATMLMSAIHDAGQPVQDLFDFLTKIQGANDDGIKSLIAAQLSKVGFFATPIGQWLESVATGAVLNLIDNNSQIQQVRKMASVVLDIANGKVLDELVKYVDQKLDITQVEKIVNEAQFSNLEPWLKDKLSKFLSKNIDFTELDKIRATLKTIRDKAAQLYSAAVKALNSTYTAAFHYTYAKTTTSTALVDVNFDFAQDPGVGAFLKNAINGDFNDLLLKDRPGVTLKAATLTHGINRQSHVQIALPYFDDTIDTINKSLATMNVVEDGGRLFAYDLNAADSTVEKLKWASSLTITGMVKVGAGSVVRTFVTDQELSDSMTFSYRFRRAVKAMRDVQLEHEVEPLRMQYFAKAFGGPNAPDKASLHEWVGDLDNHAGEVVKAITGATNGTGNLGNTLLSLEVSLPGKVVAAWFNAPGKKDSQTPYFEMSGNIQRALRRFVPYLYFGDPARYVETSTASPIIVYHCMPVSTDIRVNNDNTVDLDQTSGLFWDYLDHAKLNAMIFGKPAGGIPSTATLMNVEIGQIRRVLADSSQRAQAGLYDPGQLSQRMTEGLNSRLLPNSLLFIEAKTIEAAHEAGLAIADFRRSAGTDPAHALAALSDFGSKVTQAFNSGLGDLFDSKSARLGEFSTMIFLEAARAFDPGLATVQPLARLDVFLLRPSAPATAMSDFVDGKMPEATSVAIEQPVVGLP